METVITIIGIIKWPLALILLGLIFYRPIANLLNRIKSIKGGKYGFDTDSKTKQQDDDRLLPQDTKVTTIEKSLNLFSEDTRKIIQEAIRQETELEKLKTDTERKEALLKYSEAIYLILHFERIYNLIFGSQIRLLQHLNSSFNETTDTVKFFYDTAIKFNEHLSNYSYEKYIDYLQGQGLIEIKKDKNIQITWTGRDFLKFIVQMGLNDLKPN